jgi:hypothetical protein
VVVSKKVYLAGQRQPSSISLEICSSLAGIGGAIFGRSDEPSAAGLLACPLGLRGNNAKPLLLAVFWSEDGPCDHFLHVHAALRVMPSRSAALRQDAHLVAISAA